MRARSILSLLLVLLLVPGCSIDTIVPLPPDVVYPSIEPVQDAPPMAPTTISWQFEGKSAGVSVPVDAAVYQGAKNAQKSALFFAEVDELEWIPAYYRAFVDEVHQEPTYDSMLASLSQLRDTLQLDDDRYVELIVSAVQSLTYRTDPKYLEPKFPIETLGDGDGDCDDKTLLVTALLAREGYDVAMLLFSAEQHVTLGIRSNGASFKNSGYTIVEMTTCSLFGWVPEGLDEGEVVLRSEPMVIKIGDGTRVYGAARQADAIRAAYDRAIAEAEALDAQIKERRDEIDRLASEVQQSQAELERLAASGDIAGYNARVAGHNDLVARYGSAIDAHNALVDQQKQAVETAQRIFNSQTDRHGLAQWLGVGP
ncbi:MAG: hypothetical protein RBS78_06990 [Coriobacteriia bacterium]|jgi:hypothetical protein|nr:hypothetical protein [Coriobacteriia bacterium]